MDKVNAGEWTEIVNRADKELEDTVSNFLAGLGYESGKAKEIIRRAINAALAAEREKYEAACEGRDQFKAQLSDADKQLRKGSSLEASHQTFNELVHDNQQLREQLAAAVEALKTVSDGLRGQRGSCFNCDSAVTYIDSALAKIGEK